jgi:putative OmpL-like beta-barrel porin-2/carboxypeptidase family protein
MKFTRNAQRYLISALMTGMAAVAQSAAPAPPAAAAVTATVGTIVGVVLDSSKQPVPRATVTIIRADGGSMRSTVAGSDGVYSFADVTAGQWSIISQAEGFTDAAPVSVAVVASKPTRYDIAMGASSAPPVAPHAAAAPMVAAARAPTVPEALQAPEPGPEVDTVTPFADTDTSWANGVTRNSTPVFDTKFFTPEIRLDVNYLQSFNQPKDHTLVGSTEQFRSGEFQIEQVSFGGDFHWHNVRARFLSMFGEFATTTPRNDASAGVGEWDIQGAYKYMSEANAGYHWDVNHGLNVDAGIFVSYIGLFSYYNFDNWIYQPSFVSSNTPWFFNGLRVQWFPTQHLKIEPWLINGWQSYNKFNNHPGVGGQIEWIPNDNVKMVFNSYTLGQDNLSNGVTVNSNGTLGGNFYGQAVNPCNGGNPNADIGVCNATYKGVNWAHVQRIHEDDSLLVKYYDSHGQSGAGVSKMAFSLTWDLGCEYGGGVSCTRGPNKESFVGVMAYDRTWFDHDLYAVSFGGGFMNNPGRYLALLPPINEATAVTGSPYFTENPGQKLYQWDSQINFQYMPKPWITWWTETDFRHSDVPYWTGPGGVTPPGGNNGAPASMACNNGSAMGSDSCANEGGTWFPDLRKREVVWGAGVMIKF